MQQKIFHNFLPQEAGAFGNNIEKETQKPRPKLGKYIYDIFTENICSACNQMQMAVFFQKCTDFAGKRLKFSHFEGSIMPYHNGC